MPFGTRPDRAENRRLGSQPRLEFTEPRFIHLMDGVSPALAPGELLVKEPHTIGFDAVLQAAAPAHLEGAAELGLEPPPTLHAPPVQLVVRVGAFGETGVHPREGVSGGARRRSLAFEDSNFGAPPGEVEGDGASEDAPADHTNSPVQPLRGRHAAIARGHRDARDRSQEPPPPHDQPTRRP